MDGLNELTREQLTAQVLDLRETVQTQAAQIAEMRQTIQQQAEHISQLEDEISRLSGPKPKPGWVKPNAQKAEKRPRKRRRGSHSRSRLIANRIDIHVMERCPDCGRALCGGAVKWRHQVIEIPVVQVEVTDHLFMERRCGVCGKRWTPDAKVILGDVVMGKRTIGIRLMSTIAYLKTVCRAPIGLIRRLLKAFYGVKLSVGEITELLHAVAQAGESAYAGLADRVRGSPVVHGDETGWREDGVNGYLWSFSTPEVRCYTYNQSRGSAVVQSVLSDSFSGVLVSDFYGAYNIYDGFKQRCWVHLKRDLEALTANHSDKPAVVDWVNSVLGVYYRAKEVSQRNCSEEERTRLRLGFETALQRLVDPYVKDKLAPQRVLAKRIDRFMGELFTFVQYPEAPSENNAAERAIRPAVIARKVSGGTRSSKGSNTMSVLRSLFETWTLQGCNCIQACGEMIIQYNTAHAAS